MFESEEFRAEIKDVLLSFRVTYNEKKMTIILPDETVEKSWTYDPGSQSMEFINLEEPETEEDKIFIQELTESSCTFIKDETEYTYIPAPAEIDKEQFGEISEYASFQGNPNGEVVVINTQGGPLPYLDDTTLFGVMRGSDTLDMLYVNVHQFQTKNPSLFEEKDISFEDAKNYDNQSIDDLMKVISYFKENTKKKIYVLGISFGAFMVQDLIARHGIDDADAYIAIVGRLDIDTKFWNGFSQGKNGEFKYKKNNKYKISLSKEKDFQGRNMNRLAAGLGHKRYTEELQSIDDLSKLTYIYGDVDDKVGGLSESEINFLKSKNANVIKISGANHNMAISAGTDKLKQILGQ